MVRIAHIVSVIGFHGLEGAGAHVAFASSGSFNEVIGLSRIDRRGEPAEGWSLFASAMQSRIPLSRELITSR